MKIFDWKSLLTEWNHALLSSKLSENLADDVRQIAWLGYPSATEDEIAALEQKINRALPPSYRQFLAFTNGWALLSAGIGPIWPVRDVAWFSEHHSDVIEALQDFDLEEAEMLRAALEVSEFYDGAAILLNPDVVDDAGEWQAVRLHDTDPPQSYASFWDLVNHEIQETKRLMVFSPQYFGRTDTLPTHKANLEKVMLAITFIEERISLLEKVNARRQLPQEERVKIEEIMVMLRNLLAQVSGLKVHETDAAVFSQRKAELLDRLQQPAFFEANYPIRYIVDYSIFFIE